MTTTSLIFKRPATDNNTDEVLLLFGDVIPIQQTGTLIKTYTATGWVTGTLKRWNGSAWVSTNLKRKTSNSWV